jgi:YfiH family protein
VLQRKADSNGVVFYTSPLLEQIGVPHGFTTRIGGVSAVPFDTLNLGNPPGDTRDSDSNVSHNLARVEMAIELQNRQRLSARQVHGARVLIANSDDFSPGQEADALLTDDHRAYVLVRVADCVPILLASDDGAVVGAVHAGWRGVIAGAVPAALDAMAKTWCRTSDRIIAAIGPCIGFDAFEVGPEVIAAFIDKFGPATGWRERHVDLVAAVRQQLRSAGVPESNIDHGDRCTFRDRDEFFSHRRDRGLTGRMAAVIAPEASRSISPPSRPAVAP